MQSAQEHLANLKPQNRSVKSHTFRPTRFTTTPIKHAGAEIRRLTLTVFVPSARSTVLKSLQKHLLE